MPNSVLMMDWKSPPTAKELAQALAPFGIHVTQAEIGTEDTVVVFTSEPVTAAEALAIFDAS